MSNSFIPCASRTVIFTVRKTVIGPQFWNILSILIFISHFISKFVWKLVILEILKTNVIAAGRIGQWMGPLVWHAGFKSPFVYVLQVFNSYICLQKEKNTQMFEGTCRFFLHWKTNDFFASSCLKKEDLHLAILKFGCEELFVTCARIMWRVRVLKVCYCCAIVETL